MQIGVYNYRMRTAMIDEMVLQHLISELPGV